MAKRRQVPLVCHSSHRSSRFWKRSMPHIIELKKRIKAVETIQKTTHAMRLTSMSTHSRLIKQKVALNNYKKEIEDLLNTIQLTAKSKKISQECTMHSNQLTIIVGTQKGLCGAFNTRLAKYYNERVRPQYPEGPCIAIGKKIIDLLPKEQKIIHKYPQFAPTNLFNVVGELTHHIMGKSNYAHIIIVSNHPQSFFNQKPTVTHITPPCNHILTQKFSQELYELCDPNPQTVLANLESLYLKSQLETLFFNSLVAEYSARFLSMDSSTNNAEKLLSTMQRDYNKLRQASITNELMDLMGGML